MRTSRIIPSVVLTVSLLATACGSTPPDSLATADVDPTTTVAPVETADAGVAEQVSGNAQAIEPTGNDDTAEVTTTAAPEETPEPPVETTEAPVETTEAPVETTEAPEVETCEAPDRVGHFIDVALDDSDGGLNIRSGPGTSFDVLTTYARGSEVISTGECTVVGSTDWWEVTATDGSLTGWAASRFLSNDPVYNPGLGASMPDPDNVGFEFGTVDQMLDHLADNYGFDADRTITEVSGDGIDAIGAEGVWDITGLKDDSVSGYRVEILYNFVKDDNAEKVLGFTPIRIQRSPLCSRGVTDDGICI